MIRSLRATRPDSSRLISSSANASAARASSCAVPPDQGVGIREYELGVRVVLRGPTLA